MAKISNVGIYLTCTYASCIGPWKITYTKMSILLKFQKSIGTLIRTLFCHLTNFSKYNCQALGLLSVVLGSWFSFPLYSWFCTLTFFFFFLIRNDINWQCIAFSDSFLPIQSLRSKDLFTYFVFSPFHPMLLGVLLVQLPYKFCDDFYESLWNLLHQTKYHSDKSF